MGEWSVAKNGYVKSDSGWVSGLCLLPGLRAACSRSGHPVSRQCCGGRGLLAFSSVDEATEAILEVVRHGLRGRPPDGLRYPAPPATIRRDN
jgi:hypothetical protein